MPYTFIKILQCNYYAINALKRSSSKSGFLKTVLLIAAHFSDNIFNIYKPVLVCNSIFLNDVLVIFAGL